MVLAWGFISLKNFLLYQKLRTSIQKVLRDKLSNAQFLNQRDLIIILSYKEYCKIQPDILEIEKKLTLELKKKVCKMGIECSQPLQVMIINNEDTLPRLKVPKGMLNTVETVVDSEMGMTKKFVKTPNNSSSVETGWILKVVEGMDQGRQYMATTAVVKIGRNADNHIYLKDPKVSRRHAVIRFQGNKMFIKDLKSTNGTKVNNQIVADEQELFPGEEIKVGETVIQLQKISS